MFNIPKWEELPKAYKAIVTAAAGYANVILCLLSYVGVAGSGRDDRLAGLRELFPLRNVEHEVVGRAAFPPAGIIIERRDFVEAELLVVIGADPLGRIHRTLFERRIDVAPGELLRHDAELLHDVAGKPRDTHLDAAE